MNVTDRVAVITGAGQGIGAGIASVLGAAGAKVVVNDLIDERVEESVAALQSDGIDATGVASDVGTADGAEALIAGAVDAHGRIDILVNNAGIARDGWLAKMSEENWDEVLRVNTKSQFLTCRASAPHMMEQEFGRIINISSRAWLGGPGQANYAASKALLSASPERLLSKWPATRSPPTALLRRWWIPPSSKDSMTRSRNVWSRRFHSNGWELPKT